MAWRESSPRQGISSNRRWKSPCESASVAVGMMQRFIVQGLLGGAVKG
jgi:hypothetical protein